MAKTGEKWKEVKHLGSGGFGAVTLWQDEVTGKQIAVKCCRVQTEMTERHKSRWRLECDMMLRLRCHNVVHALPTPKQFIQQEMNNDIPVLVMEYCRGGDLRKVLVKPENACGLSEAEVRAIAHDIGAGLEFLHRNKVIHRDLKPENVVMQIEDDKITYKIIDLGYAKDMEQGSVCTSFVGTMQYLAPELFQPHARYTNTVDFWSFGIMMFECITGYRPFFPSLNPYQWHYDVAKKSDDHIHACYIEKNKVQFSSQIPMPHRLNRMTQLYMEQWLRLMLRWDPQIRGGVQPNNDRAQSFNLLDNILSTPIVTILHVAQNELQTLPNPKFTTLLQETLIVVQKHTQIPLDDQIVLNGRGERLSLNSSIQAQLDNANPADYVDDQVVLYLFERSSDQFQKERMLTLVIPSQMAVMMREPESCMVMQDMKKTWAQVVYYCEQSVKACKRLLFASHAAMLHLWSHHKKFLERKDALKLAAQDLIAELDFYNKSFEFDQERYKEQAASGIASNKIFSTWLGHQQQVKGYGLLVRKVQDLMPELDRVSSKVVDLHNSSLMRAVDTNPFIGKLNEIAKKTLVEFKKLRNSTDDVTTRSEPMTNASMYADVKEFVQERDNFYSALCEMLRDTFEALNEVQGYTNIEQVLRELKRARDKTFDLQRDRQKSIWILLRKAVDGAQKTSGLPLHKVPEGEDLPDRGDLVSRLSRSSSDRSIKSSLMQSFQSPLSNRSSQELCDELEDTKQRLNELLSSVVVLDSIAEQEELKRSRSIDWSFLDGAS